MVPRAESGNYALGGTSPKSFGTFIQLEVEEIGENHVNPDLRYRVSLKLTHPLFIKTPKTDQYTLQIFFIRSSEMTDLHRRVQSKISASNRIWYAKFDKFTTIFECSPIAPFLLNENYQENTTCALSNKPGREFYCKDMPSATTCETNKLLRIGYKPTESKRLGTLLEGFNPDKYYEHLVYKQNFNVGMNTKTVNSDDHQPYWDGTVYKDPLVPSMTSQPSRRSVLKNKIFVSVGDSINWHLIGDLKRDAGRCVETSWNFLGLKSDDKLCGNVREYAPTKWVCKEINTTFYHIWHGNPLHNPWNGHSKFSCPLIQHYAGEILDRMVEHGWFGVEYVVFTDVGVHLAIFNPIVVYRRLVDVEKSAAHWVKVGSELKFKPGKVIYKGMLYNRGDLKNVYSTVSSTIMKRIQELAEFIFGNSCVKVFDFWGLSESVFDHQKVGEIHPGLGVGSSGWITNNVRNRFLGLLANEFE